MDSPTRISSHSLDIAHKPAILIDRVPFRQRHREPVAVVSADKRMLSSMQLVSKFLEQMWEVRLACGGHCIETEPSHRSGGGIRAGDGTIGPVCILYAHFDAAESKKKWSEIFA